MFRTEKSANMLISQPINKLPVQARTKPFMVKCNLSATFQLGGMRGSKSPKTSLFSKEINHTVSKFPNICVREGSNFSDSQIEQF